MKRYYISKIVGDGTWGNAFRPKVADYGVDWAADIISDETGRPLHAEALVIVATNNPAQLRNDPDIDPMPDFPMDGKVSAIQQKVKTDMFAKLTARGFNVSGLDNADGYRDVLQAIGQQRSANFNIDSLDVAE